MPSRKVTAVPAACTVGRAMIGKNCCGWFVLSPAQMVLPLPVGAHTKQLSSLLYKEVNTCTEISSVQ